MSREKELAKNTIILSFGKMLPKLTTFITTPILTARLTKAEYGTFDLITTLVMLLVPIATLQIQSAAFRFLIECRKNPEKIKSVVTNIFVVTIPMTVFVSFVAQFFFSDLPQTLRILIPIYFILDTLYLTCGQIVRGIGKNKIYSTSAIFVSIVNMACVILLVQVTDNGLQGVMIALTVANLIGTLYYIVRTGLLKYIAFSKVSLSEIRELIAYSWPMVPNNLSTWVLQLSDRLVITGFLGVEVNAVYSAANKVPHLLSLAHSIMVMAWQENASIAVGDDDASDYYSKMLDTTFSLMFGLTALLIAGTPILFAILIRGDYADAYYQMPVLILAMFFFAMSSYFGGIYIAHKKTTNVGISTMVAAAINLAVDLALVNVIGIWAGSLSTLVAYSVLYFYRMFNVQKFQPIQVNLKKQTMQIAGLIVMLILCFLNLLVLNVVNILLGAVFFLLFNKEMAVGILQKLKR